MGRVLLKKGNPMKASIRILLTTLTLNISLIGASFAQSACENNYDYQRDQGDYLIGRTGTYGKSPSEAKTRGKDKAQAICASQGYQLACISFGKRLPSSGPEAVGYLYTAVCSKSSRRVSIHQE